MAVEVSDKAREIGIGLPADPGKTGMHTLGPSDGYELVSPLSTSRLVTSVSGISSGCLL